MIPKHSMDGLSAFELSRTDLHAEGGKGVIFASLFQSMRKPTSSDDMDGSAPAAARGAVEVLSDEALEVPNVATLKPSPEPKGREAALAVAAVVLAFP